MRLAVVSPFVDRRHGTERALSELIERLARDYHCEIHLYSESVEGLPLEEPAAQRLNTEPAGIFWHRVPALPGPHLFKFIGWMLLNGVVRCKDRWLRRLYFDLVLSPGINCRKADVILVHALFRRLSELSASDRSEGEARNGFWRDLHRGLQSHTTLRLAEMVGLDDYPAPDRMAVFYGQSVSLVSFLLEYGKPGQFVEFVGGPCRDGDASAGPARLLGDGPPDAAGRPGDQDASAAQVPHDACLP